MRRNEAVLDRGYSWNQCCERFVLNSYLRASSNNIEKLDYIGGTHADTAVTHRQTDVSLLWRSVNVNVT